MNVLAVNLRHDTNKDSQLIAFSVSLALAIFYSLPWIALGEQARTSEKYAQTPGLRILYLFVSVFITSLGFFQYNLFWKRRWLLTKTISSRWLLNLTTNVLLVLIFSALLIGMTTKVFNMGTAKTFFIFYLFRNTGIMLIVALVAYVVDLVAKRRADQIEILTLQHQNVETELSTLRSQVDPHFLFNSLASLSGLIRANSKEALAFVNHLSETFRYILEKRNHKLVTVKDELQFATSYIFMIKKRFAEGFQVVTHIHDEHLTKFIPQFSLQVLIENAIKHNLISSKQPLIIHISTAGNTLRVKNNLQPKPILPGYGIGLSTLSKRYLLISGQHLTIKKEETHFEVELPLL